MTDEIMKKLLKGCGAIKDRDNGRIHECSPSRLCKSCGTRISQHRISTIAQIDDEIGFLEEWLEKEEPTGKCICSGCFKIKLRLTTLKQKRAELLEEQHE